MRGMNVRALKKKADSLPFPRDYQTGNRRSYHPSAVITELSETAFSKSRLPTMSITKLCLTGNSKAYIIPSIMLSRRICQTSILPVKS